MMRCDFIPPVLDHSQVDEWVKITDDESWLHTRKLMQLEGLLVGGSSGAALAGALRWLKQEENFKKYGGVEGKNVVVLFPDGSVFAASTCSFFLCQQTRWLPIDTLFPPSDPDNRALFSL
jgi:threonine synthase